MQPTPLDVAYFKEMLLLLQILDIDWSSGLAKLKCLERVDLTLHGSFADMTVISNYYEEEKHNKTSLFLLTNPGQLHFYEYASLSIFKSEGRQNHTISPAPYHSVIPTVEPCMTIGKLHSVNEEGDTSISLPVVRHLVSHDLIKVNIFQFI